MVIHEGAGLRVPRPRARGAGSWALAGGGVGSQEGPGRLGFSPSPPGAEGAQVGRARAGIDGGWVTRPMDGGAGSYLGGLSLRGGWGMP